MAVESSSVEESRPPVILHDLTSSLDHGTNVFRGGNVKASFIYVSDF